MDLKPTTRISSNGDSDQSSETDESSKNPLPRVERPIPDFMGRMRAIFGDTPLETDSTLFIREDRDSRD